MVVNGNLPPRRLTNLARRPREYLRADELERLIAAAKSRTAATAGIWPHSRREVFTCSFAAVTMFSGAKPKRRCSSFSGCRGAESAHADDRAR